MTDHLISKQTLIDWLGDGRELAVIDIRTAEEVGYASPLLASNVPAERLLAEIDLFVPRKAVRTVLADDGSGVALRLAADLAAAGRPDVHALDGGIPAWIADGEDGLPTLDTGAHPFTAAVLEDFATPVATAEELTAWRAAGEDVIVIDSRTTPEYAREHVPGAVNIPGAELLLRFRDLVPDPNTRVLVSCAHNPRGVIGAQTLIDAGVSNPVAYLEMGTRGWAATGQALENGPTAVYGPATPAARAFGDAQIARLKASDSIPEIDRATAEAWAADTTRTTYYLDVRTPEEYAAGHLPGTRHVEGGQLLGVAFRALAVRHARVVLVDDLSGIRARTTAHWLRRRGFEIAIHLHDFAADPAGAK